MKKVWQTPQVEVLNVRETMLGDGWKHTDWTYIGGHLDVDQYNSNPGGNTGPIPAEYYGS